VTRDRWIWRAIFCAIAFLYLYFVPYFPALNNPNENSRVYQIRAAVELHTLSVNEQIAKYGPVNDLAVKDGKYYAGKAPGTTFLGIAVYAGLKTWNQWIGRPPVSSFRLLYALRLSVLATTLVFLLWFRRFLGRLVDDPRVADLLTIVLALGTMMISYAVIFVNHSLTAVCAFGAVMGVDEALRCRVLSGGKVGIRSWLWLALAGFLAAGSASLDYALLPVALMLLVWVPVRFGLRWASTVGAWAGASIPSVLTGIYHTICWGGPFKLSVSYLANREFATIHSQGVFGIVGPSKEAASSLLISASKGLLFLSPVFAIALLAVLYAPFGARRRSDAVLSLAIVAWMLLYVFSLANWDGGWTVGPRYVTVIVPFCIYSVALSWMALGGRARQILLPLLAGTGALSALVMSTTSVMFPHLPPDLKNPVRDLVWPLWRDAITPYNLGLRWLHLTGRAAQLPFLIVLALVLLYLIAAASGWRSFRRRAWWSIPSVAVAAAIVLAGPKLGARTEAESAERVRAGAEWVRGSVWYPPIAAAPVRVRAPVALPAR
jgi:hypothetical protein